MNLRKIVVDDANVGSSKDIECMRSHMSTTHTPCRPTEAGLMNFLFKKWDNFAKNLSDNDNLKHPVLYVLCRRSIYFFAFLYRLENSLTTSYQFGCKENTWG